MRLLHDIADLLLARACVGCEEPGPPLCESCASALMPLPFRVPDLATDLPPVFAGHPYEALARTVVIAHKERGVSWLTPCIGTLVGAAAQRIDSADALVPVPSHARSLRTRGRDTVREITEQAGRRIGLPVEPVLSRRRGTGQRQKSRSARERRSLAFTSAMVAKAPPHPDRRRAIVIDDVIATGTTVRICVAALRAAGWEVVGVAVAAASMLGSQHDRRSMP